MKPGGLRERKKRKTRLTIQREAMRLFTERGYEETTIEQIADAAEVSPSTFFNYFPTKEDVVFWDEYEPALVERLVACPPDQPLGAALRTALTEVLTDAFRQDEELMRARGMLSIRHPALRAKAMEDMARTQDVLRHAIAPRLGLDPDAYELRVVAAAIGGAMFEAGEEWVRQGAGPDAIAILEQALSIVEHLPDYLGGISSR